MVFKSLGVRMSNQYPRFEQRMPAYGDRFHQQPMPEYDASAGLNTAFQGMPETPQQDPARQATRTDGMTVVGKTGQRFEDTVHGIEEQLPMNPWSIMPKGWGDQIKDWTRQAKTPMKMIRQNGGGDMRGGSGGKKS